jgi:hypothetical protein
MGKIGFYMGMIWELDMEFIWFLMYKLWEWYGHLFSSHTKPMSTSNIQMVDVNTCGFGMG